MQKSRKRKQLQLRSGSSMENPQIKSSRTINGFNEPTKYPFPAHPWPTPAECLAVRDDLLALHGFPREFVKYRKERLGEIGTHLVNGEPHDSVKSERLDGDGFGGCDVKESVLDGLVRTVLSQNTTEVNSQRAFASLKSAFPSWENVLSAELKCIEDAIRCGGLAPTKAHCIKNILSCLLKKRGKLCLEYLRDMSVDDIKAELSSFKGIGPKTVSCVLMFHLQQDDFPVDTHVFEIAKAIGWVPAVADRNKTYLHLNQRIPNFLKFDLNCLLYTHGKVCRKCTTKGINQQRKDPPGNPCPLLHYCKNSEHEN